MTPAEGMKAVKKLLGPKAQVREHRGATQERREAAKAALPALREKHRALKEARDARHKAILAADGEYQALLAETKIAQQEMEQAQGWVLVHRLSAGVPELGGMFLSVKANGDNWQDLVNQLQARQKREDDFRAGRTSA